MNNAQRKPSPVGEGGPRKRWMRSGIRRGGRLATPSLIRRYAPYEAPPPTESNKSDG